MDSIVVLHAYVLLHFVLIHLLPSHSVVPLLSRLPIYSKKVVPTTAFGSHAFIPSSPIYFQDPHDHTRTHTCYLLSADDRCSEWVKMDSQGSYVLLMVMSLNFFSNIYWPFILSFEDSLFCSSAHLLTRSFWCLIFSLVVFLSPVWCTVVEVVFPLVWFAFHSANDFLCCRNCFDSYISIWPIPEIISCDLKSSSESLSLWVPALLVG